MNEDILICTCMEVYKSTIVEAIIEKNLSTFDEISEATGAGSVCGMCRDEIELIIQEIKKK